MAQTTIQIEVEANLKLIHDEFANAADLIANKYGVMINSVDFEWMRAVGEPPRVHRVETKTDYSR